MDPLSDTRLMADAASLVITGVPSTYRHLAVYVAGRGTDADGEVAHVALRLNGDTGPNYASERGANGNLSNESRVGDTALRVGVLGTDATDGRISAVSGTLFDYADSGSRKPYSGRVVVDGAGVGDAVVAGVWTGQAAVTAMEVLALNDDGSPAKFAAGTVITLYGLGF